MFLRDIVIETTNPPDEENQSLCLNKLGVGKSRYYGTAAARELTSHIIHST